MKQYKTHYSNLNKSRFYNCMVACLAPIRPTAAYFTITFREWKAESPFWSRRLSNPCPSFLSIFVFPFNHRHAQNVSQSLWNFLLAKVNFAVSIFLAFRSQLITHHSWTPFLRRLFPCCLGLSNCPPALMYYAKATKMKLLTLHIHGRLSGQLRGLVFILLFLVLFFSFFINLWSLKSYVQYGCACLCIYSSSSIQKHGQNADHIRSIRDVRAPALRKFLSKTRNCVCTGSRSRPHHHEQTIFLSLGKPIVIWQWF